MTVTQVAHTTMNCTSKPWLDSWKHIYGDLEYHGYTDLMCQGKHTNMGSEKFKK